MNYCSAVDKICELSRFWKSELSSSNPPARTLIELLSHAIFDVVLIFDGQQQHACLILILVTALCTSSRNIKYYLFTVGMALLAYKLQLNMRIKHVLTSVVARTTQHCHVGTWTALGSAFNVTRFNPQIDKQHTPNVGLFRIPELHDYVGFSTLLVGYYMHFT